MKTYFFTYLCSLFIAVIMTPLTIKAARKFNLTDKMNARKVHTRPVPRIGGVVLFVSTTVLVLIVLSLDNSVGQKFNQIRRTILFLLGCGSFIFFVGFLDDLYELRARHKFLAQTAAAVVVYLAGVRIESVNMEGLFTIHLGGLSFLVTVIWVLGITNAVNLIDGLDGLAAGISAITCVTIAILAYSDGQVMMVVLMLALLGSLTGFLFFNFNPAKIFMGDCGSMYLGFVLACGSIICFSETRMMAALALPILAMGLPIFDVAFCVLRRYLDRWGIMSPDRGHLHHRLLDKGLRHRDVVILMYMMTLLAAGFGFFMIISDGYAAISVFVSVMTLIVLAFRVCGAFRLREVLAKIRHRKEIAKKANEEKRMFENTCLELNNDASIKNWWKVISDSSEKNGFSELILTITTKHRRHKYIWQVDHAFDDANMLKVKVPIRNDENGSTIDVEAKMRLDEPLETCGRRLMLFGKLLDRYDLPRSVVQTKSGSDSRIIDMSDITVNRQEGKKWSVVKTGV